MVNFNCNNFINNDNTAYFLPMNSPFYIDKQTKINNKEKEKKNNFFKTKKGIAALACLCTVFLVLRRPGNSLGQRISKFVNRMDDKLAKAKSDGKKDFFATMCTKPISLAKRTGEIGLWATNFIPARDLFCEKAMNYLKIGKWNFGKQICDGTRKIFQKMTVAAHKTVFDKKSAKITRYLNDFAILLERSGLNKAEFEKIQKELLGPEIQGKYQREFGYANFDRRLNEYVKNIENLPQKAVDKLKQCGREKGYITDNLTNEYRSKYRSQLDRTRRNISCNRNDVINSVKSLADKIRSLLSADDIETRLLLRNLTDYDLKEMLKNKQEQARLYDTLKQITKLADKYDKPTKNNILQKLEEVNEIVNNGNSSGLMQKILQRIKGKISDKDFQKAKKIATKIGTTIDKNIDSEMRVYQKYGEMKLGSAFTDVGTLLLTAGLGSWLIAKSETLDEFFEAGLRQGFPILGTVGTLAYCTARMVPNLPSLGISLLVGAGVKKAGDFTANQYIKWNGKYKDTKEILAQYKQEHASSKA